VAYAVEFLPSAARQLASLPREVQRRIARSIDGLKENPRPRGVKLLHAEERISRLRMGDYRVLYKIEEDRLVIVVVRVAHRRESYRRR
jgi:mRNA interferase RelE/StbE